MNELHLYLYPCIIFTYVEKILILDGDESFGFRFSKDYMSKYKIKILYPRPNLINFINDVLSLNDEYDFIINNFEIDFYNKNSELLPLNSKIQEVINNKFKNGKKVFMSSQFVYRSGDDKKDENYKIEPETAYGKTKCEAEKKVMENNNYLIIRRGLTYGKCTYNIYTDILAAIRSGIPLKMNGNIIINPLLNKDLSCLTEKIINDYSNEIFNISSDEDMTLYCFGNKIYNSIRESNSNFIKTFYKNNLNYNMDNSKIKRKYSFKFSGLSDTDFLTFHR